MQNKSQTDRKSNLALSKVTLVLAKIAEVLHWCLAGIMPIAAVCAIIRPEPFADWLGTSVLGSETNISCYGFETAIIDTNGTPRLSMILLLAFGSAMVLSLMAMIFRNIYLILKTAQGRTWFAKGDTPFQQNVVRMLREIGIFFIAISVLSLISTIIVQISGGEITGSFNYLSGFVGLVFLCISQFFSYGTYLEKDLDGLV